MTDAGPVKRSTGVLIAGFDAGGGMSGRDPALDAMAVKAARLMHGRLGLETEIRFSFDGNSGGAYLSQGETVGVFVHAIDVARIRTENRHSRFRTCVDDDIRRQGGDPSGPDTQYGVMVNVSAARLKDPSLANSTGRSPHLWKPAADVAAAVDVIASLLKE